MADRSTFTDPTAQYRTDGFPEQSGSALVTDSLATGIAGRFPWSEASSAG